MSDIHLLMFGWKLVMFSLGRWPSGNFSLGGVYLKLLMLTSIIVSVFNFVQN